MKRPRAFASFLFCAVWLGSVSPAAADVVDYDLTIAQQQVNVTGLPVKAMTINRGIPGPVLRFREGDRARIRVRNDMDVETSIHWHGILVPPGMDGVPLVSFPPIAAGTTFLYEFPIRQSGTYWYHSHTALQEQRGVYGAIVIEPRDGSRRVVDREYVLVLSDWTDEDPDEVLRTLRRGSEWYALAKGGAQSIMGAARIGMLGDYLKRELQRMPPMDIADVAYDRFLANGTPEVHVDAAPGETVRLRIVDGSATTFFHLEFSGGPMTVLAADGIDVEPFAEKRLLIGVAETYDVVVEVPADGAWEFRATAHDTSAHASVWIGSGRPHPAPVVPKPNMYHAMGELGLREAFALTPAGSMGMGDPMVEKGMFDRPGMMGGMMRHMDGAMGHPMDHDMEDNRHDGGGMHGMYRAPGGEQEVMQRGSMKGPEVSPAHHPQVPPSGKRHADDFSLLGPDIATGGSRAMDGMSFERPWPPYDKLRSPKPTAFPVDKPRRDVRLTLDGDMERYVWFLNNRPLSESDVIPIRKGEIVRFIMINRTMMHHPMHLHGHFFRVINGQGDHAPLKHTVDVAPMSTTVIEFDAEEFGDWFFHCHLLYHMKAGMARVVHYEDFDPGPEVLAVRPRLYREHWYGWVDADILSNMTQGSAILSDTRNILSLDWEVGWEGVARTESEFIISWDRYVNRFFGVFVGADVLWEGDESEDVRGIVGLRYRLPFNLESTLWVDTDSGVRVVVERMFHLTPRLALFGEAQYDTHHLWEGHAGAHYTVSKRLSLLAGWHSEYGWGGGISIRL